MYFLQGYLKLIELVAYQISKIFYFRFYIPFVCGISENLHFSSYELQFSVIHGFKRSSEKYSRGIYLRNFPIPILEMVESQKIS